jgi:GNAT superfamily N-acetyltransferase
MERRRKARATLRVRGLERADWAAIERLFGANGACGGCWCMWWRVERGGKAWESAKGARNKRAFRELVEAGRADGLLAFEGAEPVGWCALGPRAEFPRTERVKALKSAWDGATWSVNCFYIPAQQRGRGVATKLLAGAIELARKRGARTLEGYPLRSTGGDIPAAFAWTGVVAMFERAGFECAQRTDSPRELWRLSLPAKRAAKARARRVRST